MKFIYKRHSNKSGVYKITNTTNGKVYIGSAKEFKERARSHHSSLKGNRHSNKHLQHAFNKDGTDAFVFEVIEVVSGDKSARTTVEQNYLDHYLDDWERCYNFKKETVAKERSCYSKTPEETRKKKSETAKRLGLRPPPQFGPMPKEQREKIAKSNTGKTASKETSRKLSESHKGYVPTEEQRRKLSQSVKRFHQVRKEKELQLLREVLIELGPGALNRDLHVEYCCRGGTYTLETARRHWPIYRSELGWDTGRHQRGTRS